jgi:hypothetical protein
VQKNCERRYKAIGTWFSCRFDHEQVAEILSKCHGEERFLRRGILEVVGCFETENEKFIPNVKNEVASLRFAMTARMEKRLFLVTYFFS